MLSVLTNTYRRRLEIIEYLYFLNDWASIKQIANELNFPEKMVEQEIDYLLHESEVVYILKSKKGICFDSKNNLKLDTIYQDVLLATPAFKIIEILLYNKSVSIEEMADRFSVSTATVQNTIKNFNISLEKQYDIYLTSSPVTFVGNETNIRSFISQYLNEKYDLFDWPFKDISNKDFEKFVLFFKKHMGIPLDFTQIEYTKILSMVSLIRYKNGFSIEEEFEYRPEEFWSTLFKNLDSSKMQEELENIVSRPITKELLINLFFPFVQKDYAFSFKDLLDKFQNNKNVARSVYAIEKMLFQLSSKYNLTIENHYELLLAMHNAFYLKYVQTDANYTLFDRKNYFCKDVKNLFPDFFADVENEIIIWTNTISKDEPKIFIQHLIYTLFTQWEKLSYQLLNKRKPVKLLILSKFDIGHAKTMSDIIQHNIDNQVDIDIYSENELNYEQLEHSDYDIIISPFPMESIKSKKVIYITNFPKYEDVLKVRDAVEDLYF